MKRYSMYKNNTTGIFKIVYSMDIFHKIIYFLLTSSHLTSFWVFCLLPYLFTSLINDSHIKESDKSIIWHNQALIYRKRSNGAVESHLNKRQWRFD